MLLESTLVSSVCSERCVQVMDSDIRESVIDRSSWERWSEARLGV